MALKELEVRYATKRAKDYKLADGEGLYLLVRPNGSKLWRMKYRYAGKEKLLSFGAYPAVSLAEVLHRCRAGYRQRAASHPTGRDLLNSFRIRSTYDTPLFHDRSGQHLKLRSVLIGLTYNLGSTPRRQPEQFDFTTLPTAGS